MGSVFSSRALLPFLVGVGLAYFLTGLVDGPPQVHFQQNNPFASTQAEVVESSVHAVLRQNILKLGTPLSLSLMPDDSDSGGLADTGGRFSPAHEVEGNPWHVRGHTARPEN